MKGLFVGNRFFKQAKTRGSDWSLRGNAIAPYFLNAVAFSEGVWD